MAITVTTPPPDYALAKTPVPLQLTTDDLYSAAGTKAVFEITTLAFSSGSFPAATETFDLTFGDTTITFTFQDSPDTSGTELTSGIGASNPSDYGLSYFMRELKRNYIILENFDVSYEYDINDDTVVILTAKEAKQWGTFSLSGTVTGLTWTTQTDGTNPVRRENFEILLDVFDEKTLYESEGYWAKIHLQSRLSAIPNDAGVASFDIAACLKPLLSTPLPNLATAITGSNYIAIVDGALRRYHLRYAERYGSTPATQQFLGWPSDSEISIAGQFSYTLNGGANNLDRATLNTNFASTYLASTNRKFLTYRGTTIIANKAMPIFLDGLSKDNTTFKAVVSITYTDGTTSTYTAPTVTKGDTLNRVLRFCIGYNQLDLDANKTVGKTVASYTVAIKDSAGSSQYFETITVTMQANKKHERYFLFENGLGGVDTLYTCGNFETGLEFTNQITQHFASDPASGVYNGEFGESANETQEMLELHTGYMTKANLNYLKDFLHSRNKYLVSGTTLLKVNIPQQNITLYTDRSQMFALKLKIQKAWTEQSV